jgi:hypothetical protein
MASGVKDHGLSGIVSIAAPRLLRLRVRIRFRVRFSGIKG